MATSFLAFSCPHVPLHDPEAIDWLEDNIRERSPDVLIHLGDGHEADSASRWPSEYDWCLSDEIEQHNDLLKRLRMAAPKARRVYLPGNHDDNIVTLNRIDKKLRGLCDYRVLESELASGNWEMPCTYQNGYVRSKQNVFRLGQVSFAHGWEASASADELQACDLGLPWGLFVSGHTHRPTPVTQAHKTKTQPLPFWYANAGTLRDIDEVPYMDRKKRSKWGQAIVVGEAEEWRYNSGYIPTSPLWSAETIVFRMFDEGLV